MKTALFCFSDAGAELCLRLCRILHAEPSDVHTIPRFAEKYGFTAHAKVCADLGEIFGTHDALIFVCACGIAVRDVAPYVKDKTTDPAVLVIDDKGRFVIPILSGQIGGANALAGFLADQLGAVPVITTATDGSGRFACDTWAITHDCAISSMLIAKKVSAAILTDDVPVSSGRPLPGTLPAGLRFSDSGALGIYIGVDAVAPYAETLRLIPRILTVGVGCRRGITADAVCSAVKETLESAGIDPRSVRGLASIDVKREESGLLEAARRLKVPIRFYSADELNAVPGEFTESEFVRKTVGVGNVCERAAAAEGGSIIIRKTAKDGVTVAAAVSDWRIEF